MITTAEEYKEQLWLLSHNNAPRKAILPEAEKIYHIDIKTRIIDSPQFLSVQKDHNAESIYFSVQRYVDYIDLAEMACIVQYKIGLNLETGPKLGLYRVPFYDITTYNTPGDEKLIFPWLLTGQATSISGPVEYSIKFFKVEEITKSPKQYKYLYNLNTLPATSTVLYGMDVQAESLDDTLDITATYADAVSQELTEFSKKDIYWIELK